MSRQIASLSHIAVLSQIAGVSQCLLIVADHRFAACRLSILSYRFTADPRVTPERQFIPYLRFIPYYRFIQYRLLMPYWGVIAVCNRAIIYDRRFIQKTTPEPNKDGTTND